MVPDATQSHFSTKYFQTDKVASKIITYSFVGAERPNHSKATQKRRHPPIGISDQRNFYARFRTSRAGDFSLGFTMKKMPVKLLHGILQKNIMVLITYRFIFKLAEQRKNKKSNCG